MRCQATGGRCQSACTHPALGGFCSILFSREAWEAVKEDEKERQEKLREND
jgi:hypothetical protein